MSSFQIFAKGLDGRTLVVGKDQNITIDSKVKDLRAAISTMTGIPQAELRIVFTSKELSDEKNEMLLTDIGIQNQSTVFLVLRLRGGSNEGQEQVGPEITVKVRLVSSNEVDVKVPLKDTILQFKQKIQTKNGDLSSDSMCLNYAGVKLVNEKKVEEYKIDEGDVVIQSKADLAAIPGLIISYEPDIISMEDSNEPRAKMVCGHVISTESMTAFLQSLLDARKYVIRCPAFKNTGQPCETEWSYPDCRKVGVLTIEEQKKFEEGFEERFVMEGLGAQQCPVCYTYILKENLTTDQVRCINCINKNQGYDFCWKCLKRWQDQNPYGSLAPCGNKDCVPFEAVNIILKRSGVKTIGSVNGVPDIRACPSCSQLINHKTACKHMKCKGCNIEFCFVCLSVKGTEGWSCGTFSAECPVAPRQQL